MAESDVVFHNAEGVKSTACVSARVDGGATTQTSREGISSATSLALAVISSNEILNSLRVKMIVLTIFDVT